MKLLIFILSTVYFLISIQFSIGLHYCQDEVKSFSIASYDLENCCEGEEESSGCCKNIHLTLKKSDKESYEKHLDFNFKKVYIDVTHSINFKCFNPFNVKSNNLILSFFIPPPENIIDRNIQFCVFRI